MYIGTQSKNRLAIGSRVELCHFVSLAGKRRYYGYVPKLLSALKIYSIRNIYYRFISAGSNFGTQPILARGRGGDAPDHSGFRTLPKKRSGHDARHRLRSVSCMTRALERLSSLAFVPKCNPTSMEDVMRLKEFMDRHKRLCVLTGAGISTESGIPDYRSAEVGLYARSNRKPILYKQFCDSETARRRYWARNYIGWPRFSSLKPNITHETLKHLEYVGKVGCIVTQNVDNLHSKAGSEKVIELHGTAFRVMCLDCDHKICRHKLQRVFQKLNPSMVTTDQMIRPDGDVELSQAQVEGFNVPACDNCGGTLKPDIVFFGDNVPHDKVQNVKVNVESLDALLILGTTLSTFSAYRIVLQAIDAKKPIAIINIGETRADKFINLKIIGRCGDVLPRIWQLNASNDFMS